MSYVLAILGLAAACAAWVLAQRWAGLLDDGRREPGAPGDRSDCDACEADAAACPAARASGSDREGGSVIPLR